MQMIDVEFSETLGVSDVVRSFAACLASVTEVPVTEVPQPDADLPGAIAHWRSWLAGRGAGLVPIANPAGFNWPGYWLAIVGDTGPGGNSENPRAVLMFGTPSGVVLSPQDSALLGAAAATLPVRRGFVVANLDPAVTSRGTLPGVLRGEVAALALAE